MAGRRLGDPDSAAKRRVLRRDGWQCRMPVCLAEENGGTRAIDPALSGTRDPWAPSVDHILRECDGGSGREENLRAAHRMCNQDDATRADRPLRGVRGQELDLAIASRIGPELAARLAELADGAVTGE